MFSALITVMVISRCRRLCCPLDLSAQNSSKVTCRRIVTASDDATAGDSAHLAVAISVGDADEFINLALSVKELLQEDLSKR
jgi:hypothetical protein